MALPPVPPTTHRDNFDDGHSVLGTNIALDEFAAQSDFYSDLAFALTQSGDTNYSSADFNFDGMRVGAIAGAALPQQYEALAIDASSDVRSCWAWLDNDSIPVLLQPGRVIYRRFQVARFFPSCWWPFQGSIGQGAAGSAWNIAQASGPPPAPTRSLLCPQRLRVRYYQRAPGGAEYRFPSWMIVRQALLSWSTEGGIVPTAGLVLNIHAPGATKIVFFASQYGATANPDALPIDVVAYRPIPAMEYTLHANTAQRSMMLAGSFTCPAGYDTRFGASNVSGAYYELPSVVSANHGLYVRPPTVVGAYKLAVSAMIQFQPGM